MLQKINRLQLEKEFLRRLTLIRYVRYGRATEEIGSSAMVDELIDEIAIETEVFLANRVYNDINQTMTMANLTPTDMVTN